MTIASRELFELCKQVYEATGWKGLGRRYINEPLEKDDWIPIYTSDYLLEKLPFPTEIGCDSFMWIGKYENRGNQIWERADTPLKALLKLTIKLHEEGLL